MLGTSTVRAPWLILLPFLACSGLDYVLRVNNAMIVPELVAEFRLGPAELGFVTSAFFVAFALAQLPLGLALDRFGPRPVMSLLLTVAAAGGLLYVGTASAAGLAAGRFLMGIGMSGSLMGGIKAARLWFPASRLPQITALLVAVTGVGGMLATGPTAELLHLVGWRQLFYGFIALLLGAAAMYWRLVPDLAPEQAARSSLGRQLVDFVGILTSFHFWRFGPIAMVGIGIGISYQTLWAPLWLRDVAGFGPRQQAWSLFALFASIALGNLAFGALSRRVLAAGRSVLALTLGGFGLSILLQLGLLLSGGGAASVALWMAISALFACPIAIYAVVPQAFAPELAARSASSLNAMVFVTVFAGQGLTGVIIGHFPIAADGRFAAAGHMASLAAVIALEVLALVWCWAAPRLCRRPA
jgi:predicted MFS family arabinose efflux permease